MCRWIPVASDPVNNDNANGGPAEPTQVAHGDVDGDDIVLGDTGYAVFDTSINTALPRLVRTANPAIGGDDFIFTGDAGDDTVLAGRGRDWVDTGQVGDDIVVGDHGFVDFAIEPTDEPALEDSKVSVVAQVMSTDPGTGDDDVLLVRDGDDVVVAGDGADFVNYVPVDAVASDPLNNDNANGGPAEPTQVGGFDTGDDIVLGDNGNILFDTSIDLPLLTRIETSDPTIGGDDFIFTGDAGDDAVLAGFGKDWVDTGQVGHDIVVGDNGLAVFNIEETDAPLLAASKISVLMGVMSTDPGTGDDDVLLVRDGDDVVVAGDGADLVNYVPVGAVASDPTNNVNANGGPAEPTQVGGFDTGDDVVFGDNGVVTFDTTIDLRLLEYVETSDPTIGGDDFIFTGEAGDDVVLAGAVNDWVDTGETGDDIVLGDHGFVDFAIEPTDFAELADSKVSVVAQVMSTDPDLGGDDVLLVRDGDDIVVGGFGADLVNYAPVNSVASDPTNNVNANGGPAEPTQVGGFDAGDDVVLGDNGNILFDTSIDLPLLDFIETKEPAIGGDDFIFTGEAGDDVVLAGAVNDWVDTGETGDDIVLGDHGFVDFAIEPTDFAELADSKVSVVAQVTSTDPDLGGDDVLLVRDGDDVVVAGDGADLVNYVPVNSVASDPTNNVNANGGPAEPTQVGGFDTGDDVVLGDNGNILFDTSIDLPLLDFIETTDPTIGGDDFIFTGDAGDDTVLAGRGRDWVDTGQVGDDIVVGDHGFVDFAIEPTDEPVLEDSKVSVVAQVMSTDPDLGGDDVLLVRDGDDVVVAGDGADLVNYVPVNSVASDPTNNVNANGGPAEPTQVGGFDTGDDIVLGDNGNILFDTSIDLPLLDFIETTDPTIGGDDFIFTGEAGDDVVLAGAVNDWVDTGETGDDIVFGDHGFVDFAIEPTDFAELADSKVSVVAQVMSTDPDLGGDDVLLVADGDDIVVGGFGADLVNYVPVGAVASDPTNNVNANGGPAEPTQVGGFDAGDDVVLGDNGNILFDTSIDLPLLDFIETKEPAIGGDDFIFTGEAGDDVVLAGAVNDWVDTGETGDDIVVGDHGFVDFAIEPTDEPALEDSKVSVVAQVMSTDPDLGGDDVLEVNQGDDIVVGGFGADLVNYIPINSVNSDPTNNDNANGGPAEPTQVGGFDTGDDIVLGDNGVALFDTSIDLPLLTEIRTTDPEIGGDDFIFTGEAGDDVVLAGAVNDWVDTGETGDDIVFGDHGVALFNIEDTNEPALEDSKVSVVAFVDSTDPELGGDDVLEVNQGDDIVIAGVGNDLVNYIPVNSVNSDPTNNVNANGGAAEPTQVGDVGAEDDDIVIGDNGTAFFDTSTLVPLETEVRTTDYALGGDDFIFTDDGDDIVLAGTGSDWVDTGEFGDDIFAGDNGVALFNLEPEGDGPTPGEPGGLKSVLREIASLAPETGGNDVILTRDGDDTGIAGVGDDMVNYVPVGTVASDPALNAIAEPTQIGDDGGSDIVIGDNGMALFDTRTGRPLLDDIRSFEPLIGGVDYIFTDKGPDVVIGGTAGDVIDAGTDEGGDLSLDVVIADNGIGDFNVDTGESLLVMLRTTDPEIDASGDDTVTTGGGNDVILGGSGADDIDAGADFFKDVVLGDNGRTWFYLSQILQFAFSTDPFDGGNDRIFTGMGADYVIGGVADDWIDAGRDSYGDASQDAVLGDNGQIDVNSFGQLVDVHTTAEDAGGDDFIITGGGRDIVFGGSQDDMIQSGTGNDHVNGDNGFAWFEDKDGNAGLFHVVQTTDPLIGGRDLIFAGAGYDVVFGGTDEDTIFGGGDSDLLLGDHGRFDRSLAPRQNWYSIFTSDADGGAADTIYGDDGEFADGLDPVLASGYHDMILGQQGADMIFGGPGDDDITGGHNVVGGADTGDFIDGQQGADVVLGDNGVIYRIVTSIETPDGGELDWATYPDPFTDLIRSIQRYDDIDLVEGDDVIDGSDGRDELHGQRGDDDIDGGAGDDSLFGELGDDLVEGGIGHDIVLGDVGVIKPAFNADGTPRQNSDESWHRDVFLEQIGRITGYVVADTSDDYLADPATAAAILGADLVIAAHVDPADVESRHTLFILIELEDTGDDIVTGGSGNDALFGQRGDDEIAGGDERSARIRDDRGNFVTDGDDLLVGGLGNDRLDGGTGDDLLVGDEFTNTLRVDMDMSEVIHGVRIISDDIARQSNTNTVVIAFGGTVLVPPVVLSAEDIFNDGLAYRPLVNTRSDLENGHELVLEQGEQLAPHMAIIPDIFHNADMASGNDLLVAGWGNDIVVGDDLTMHTPEFTRFDEINLAFADLTSELIRLGNELHAYAVTVDTAEYVAAGIGSFHPNETVIAGSDTIFGGLAQGNARPNEGIDTVIGDDVTVQPTVIGEPIDEELYEEQALAYHLLLRGLEHVAADGTIFLSERNADLTAEIDAAAAAADLHRLSMGNDLIDIDLDDGPDTAVGDNGLDPTGLIVGTTVLDAELRAAIEEALRQQQAGIVDPYTLHDRERPATAAPVVDGTFGVDEFIADDNDRIVAESSALVLPGVLDAATPE